MTYYVTFKIDARFVAGVEADSLEEARKKAEEAFSDADFGEAIRPCAEENPNAIRWGQLRNDRWVVNTMSCRGLSRTLFALMSWEDEGRYKFRGQFINQGDQKLLVFELDEPVITKKVEQIFVPEKPDDVDDVDDADGANDTNGTDEAGEREEIIVRETVRVYPESWRDSIGVPVASTPRVSVLVQKHYAGDWDVLRPAKELEEMNIFTAEKLAELKQEADTILKGWKRTA